MITAIYSHGKNKKNRNNSILFVVIIMFVAYAVGCITTGILSTTDYLSELFEMLMLISQNYGYTNVLHSLLGCKIGSIHVNKIARQKAITAGNEIIDRLLRRKNHIRAGYNLQFQRRKSQVTQILNIKRIKQRKMYGCALIKR